MPRSPSHFDALLELLGKERAEEQARFEQRRVGLSVEQRVAEGLALADLEVVDESAGLGGRFLITLERADRKPLETRFDPGSLVELKPRRAEVPEPARGVVARRTPTRLTVAFEEPPPAFVGEGRLVADLTPSSVTFERARAAVTRWRDAGKDLIKRREVLLGNEAPRFERTQPREPSRPLNAEQRAAVERGLAAEDFFLVHGPPGTGKSTVLVEIAVQAVRAGERVLCTAPSNAAVDHLLDLLTGAGLKALRIGHPARVAERLQEYTLDMQIERHPDRVLARELFEEAFELLGYAGRQRRQGRSRERFANARASQREARELMAEARKLEARAVRSLLDDAEVVCATCAALESRELAGRSFARVLFDEATQAIEPIALLAFLRGPRVVLAGDPQQLAPTVLSREAAALGVSLFERLLQDHGPAVKQLLREQHRMHATIMEFPSREMYGGELRAHPSVAGHTLGELLQREVDAPPVLFLDTAGKGLDDRVVEGTESHDNPGEVELVVARARELVAAGLAPSAMAVIAPYRAQVALLRDALRDLEDLEIDTVDGFQGREKEAVLVTLVRSNGLGQVGFLADLRRMNVAITRARRHLFVVGDSATLASHPYYQRFVEHVQAAGGYRSVWDWSP